MNVNIVQINSGEKLLIKIECLDPTDGVTPIDVSGYQEFKFKVKNKRGKVALEKSMTDGDIIFVTDGIDGELYIKVEENETHNMKGLYRYTLSYRDDGNILKKPVKSFLLVSGEDL